MQIYLLFFGKTFKKKLFPCIPPKSLNKEIRKACKHFLKVGQYKQCNIIAKKFVEDLMACGFLCHLEEDYQHMSIFFRCHIVNQFNEGLYDIIIASDENLLMDPKTKPLDPEKKKDKK